MTFREKSTALLLAILLIVYGNYFLDLWHDMKVVPVEQIAYQGRMTFMVIALVVLAIIGHVVISGTAPEEADQVDERDRAIERVGDQWAGYVLAGWALAAMAMAMFELPHFYIANNILAGLVFSEVLKSALMLYHYRRGY